MKAILVCLLAWNLQSNNRVESFAPSSGQLVMTTSRTRRRRSNVDSPISSLSVVADAEEKEKKANNNDHDDDENKQAWTSTPNGGFLPNWSALRDRNLSTAAPTKQPVIETVSTLDEYKQIVLDEADGALVCVRFYAPWCRACKAVQARYRRLASEYSKKNNNNNNHDDTSSTSHHLPVKFVECPLTKDNAFLHQGLGVPSLPFGHIYHPTAGLVEERKINKSAFPEFAKLLQTYVEGSCDVLDDDDDDGDDDDDASTTLSE